MSARATLRARAALLFVRVFRFLSMTPSEELVRLNCRGLGRGSWRGRGLFSAALLFAIAFVVLQFGSLVPQSTLGGNAAAPPFALAKSGGSRDLHIAASELPLVFEPNQGQTDPQVKFLARGAGYGLFLTANEAVLALQGAAPHSQASARRQSVLHMQLVGAGSNQAPVATDQLPGRSNYFFGNDPSRWHRGIPQFARVRYPGVYPGIDLVYYGNHGQLEYDFEVAPGADSQQIELRFQGSNGLLMQDKPQKNDASGDLLIRLQNGEAKLQAPRVYQEISGTRRFIPARFVARGHNQVGFELGEYDRTRALVIDPILAFSSYLGGSGDEACSVITKPLTGTGLPISGCPGIAVDSASNIYIAGSTTSTDFPGASTSHLQPNLAGVANVFVIKFDASGANILFSTYLGGSQIDFPAGIAVNSGLDVVVAGTTTSTDFPVTGVTAFQAAPTGLPGEHVFVSELDTTGSNLVYSTYLSGNGNESAAGVAVDFRNKIYVLGTTTSTNTPTATTAFPATLGAFQTCSSLDSPPAATQCGTNRFFLSKLDAGQTGFTSLNFSTYFSGGNPANAVTVGGGIAVDIAANVYITGGTNYSVTGTASTDFPLLNAYQGCLNVPPTSTSSTCTSIPGNTDAFVAKFNPSASPGAQLLYSTYLGGAGNDVGHGVSVDSGFNAFVTGSTNSSNFVIPVNTTPFQNKLVGLVDAFLGKFGNPCTGTGCATITVPLNYFSYLGGTGTNVGLGVAVDSTQGSIGGARITGYTNAADFPLNPLPGVPIIQKNLAGQNDAFVSRIDTTATTTTAPGNYGTYLGGSANDYGTSIATDAQGATYVTGETASTNFLVSANAFQPNSGGKTDAFFAKLSPTVGLIFSPPASASPSQVGVGSPITYVFRITNNGDPVQTFTVLDTLPIGGTFSAASASPGSCTTTVVNGTVQCTVGPLNAGASANVNVTVNPTAPNPPNTAPIQLTDSALILLTNNSTSATATVNDFSLTVSPNAPPPVVAGAPASMNATVTPTGNIPNTVTLSCGSGLPTGAACTFPDGPSIPNLSNGAQSRQLVISTTERVTTPASLWRSGSRFYAIWLPIAGLAFLGFGAGRNKARYLLPMILVACLSSVLFQAACSNSASTTATTGTPAGTYIINVNATSGTAPAQAVRTQQVTLTVQ